jgi:HD superfamily phosphodiesterase
MEKELLCHLQFVLFTASEITHEFREVHRECIFVASLIHDIGRPYSSEENPHE